ncbi:MAG: discoidin domain-containing protein, partial [Verrucomicrobia bacterium]|nr:discoidin domain-containing protein [Verrucomicrobiota bacterium]
MEYGGKCGLEPARRELWLFHCLSPAWVRPGEHLAIRNAPTEFGPISATMAFTDTGAKVSLEGKFHTPPADYRLRVPYFKELVRFGTDAREQRREGDCIILSPDATRLSIEWRDKPGAHVGAYEDLLTAYRAANRFAGVDTNGFAIVEAGKPFLLDSEKSNQPRPLSFALVRAAFQHEYQRRADEAVKNGGKLIRVSAPAMLPPGEPDRESNLATGCKVECSSHEPGFGPELAVDGNLSLESSWRANPYPQWLKLDLGKSCKLTGIHVWPYWGNGRYYQYKVEVSTDGTHWTQVGDKLTNVEPATEAGDTFKFAPSEVRFIRVTMIYNSLNLGVHIVEVKAIEDGKPGKPASPAK